MALFKRDRLISDDQAVCRIVRAVGLCGDQVREGPPEPARVADDAGYLLCCTLPRPAPFRATYLIWYSLMMVDLSGGRVRGSEPAKTLDFLGYSLCYGWRTLSAFGEVRPVRYGYSATLGGELISLWLESHAPPSQFERALAKSR